MCVLIDREDHLPVHVLEIRPEHIERDIVLVVLAHDLADHGEGFVAPATLMVPEAPKRRDVAPTDVLVIALEDFFGVGLAQKYDEVQGSADGVIHKLVGVLP